MESTFTFRVDATLKKAFEQAAKSNDRSSSQLLRDFMRDYVKRHAQGDLLADKKGGR
ncbi:ribbon-helix-helix protein, CopG family [Xanthomonas campestris pv. campestris]|uniref:CopG family ribbon-helix-helix protein n=1 Tax=Xanthomonas campestris TaxID=339 RepID=UPI002ADE96E7|nr:ribbon-helix-helix protein, CopG family [Xanthomonas campestris pv. campestris]